MVNESIEQEEKPTCEKTEKPKFSCARGTRDILPDEQKYWQLAREKGEKIAAVFGFRRIEVPTFESAALFDRSIGSHTDMIAKELYLIRSKDEKEDHEGKAEEGLLALRPELTAGIARGFLSNGLNSWPQPVKLFSLGPVFRHERPQKGRYREHFQLDFEIIGDPTPKADAWTILAAWEFFQSLGLRNIEIQINSLGSPESQKKYKKSLEDYYRPLSQKLCQNCQERLQHNPLRLLDCKEESCQIFKEDAPKTIDHLDESSQQHFMDVLALLDSFHVSYNLNPFIVRGLDYYCHTTFEICQINPEDTSDHRGGAHQIALGGGGRYDGLIQSIGGNQTPGVGVAIGLDRTVELIKSQKIQVEHQKPTAVFVIGVGPRAIKRTIELVLDLLHSGISCDFAPDKTSLRSQLRAADKIQAEYSIIIGEKEAQSNTCIIRDMKSGIQEDASCDELVSILSERLKCGSCLYL